MTFLLFQLSQSSRHIFLVNVKHICILKKMHWIYLWFEWNEWATENFYWKTNISMDIKQVLILILIENCGLWFFLSPHVVPIPSPILIRKPKFKSLLLIQIFHDNHLLFSPNDKRHRKRRHLMDETFLLVKSLTKRFKSASGVLSDQLIPCHESLRCLTDACNLSRLRCQVPGAMCQVTGAPEVGFI